MSTEKEKPKTPYKYSTEIGQMCYIFGCKDTPETVLQHMEDIVKFQLNEILVAAKSQALRRGARYISTEDILFLLRHRKDQLARFRLFLSWQELKRKVSTQLPDDPDQEYVDEITEEPTNDRALKVTMHKVPLRWDLEDMYSELIAENSDDDEPDSSSEGLAVTRTFLQQADEMTKNMTPEQYQYFSECRSASFTYRKTKKFRDFLNLPNAGESEDVLDTLGLLAYETIHTLCIKAQEINKERVRIENKEKPKGDANAESDSPRKAKRAKFSKDQPPVHPEPTSIFSIMVAPPPSETQTPNATGEAASGDSQPAAEPEIPPIGDCCYLSAEDVAEAYAQLVASPKEAKDFGFGNWRTGLVRTKPLILII